MSDYVRVCILESEAQATILASMLAEKGIPHRVETHRDSAFDGVYEESMGWGRLDAPEAHKDEILALVANLATEGGEP